MNDELVKHVARTAIADSEHYQRLWMEAREEVFRLSGRCRVVALVLFVLGVVVGGMTMYAAVVRVQSDASRQHRAASGER